MTDVTKANFERVRPVVEDLIKKCSFISVDAEFTGLYASKERSISLSDSIDERYDKLRDMAKSFTLLQCGLAIFVNESTNPSRVNHYQVHCFNFNIFPLSCGSQEECFLVQPSSVEFLRGHSFDFHKVFCEGIPFLNLEQEAAYAEELKLGGGGRGGEGAGDKKRSDKSVPAAPQDGINSVLDEAVGFGHIFRCMVKAKKPLVGHNMLLDLAFMFQKFHHNLPQSYLQFKDELHRMFPLIVDTKRLCFSLRQLFSDRGERELLFQTHLEGIYRVFTKKKTIHMKVGGPIIQHAGDSKYGGSEHFHEAGFDAYSCGYVFLRVAHMAAMEGVKSSQAKPLPFSEYMLRLAPHVNRVHMIRGPVYFVNLAGDDPPSPRPHWIVVQKRFHCKLTNQEVVRLVKTFKGVDHKEVYHGSSWSVWLASPSLSLATDMCRLGIHPELIVRRYSWWRDSPKGWLVTRLLAVCCVCVCTAVPIAFYCYRNES